MESIEHLPLAKIVNLKPESASVFEKHNLDFCCKGKQTLSEALAGNVAEFKIVKIQLEDLFSKKDINSDQNFDNYTVSELVDYIVARHHAYVKEMAPIITGHLNKVADKHGNRYPYLIRINQLFADVIRELINHLMKEEVILFPRIKSLEKATDNETAKAEIQSPIKVMLAEHDMAGNLMSQIRELTGNYTPPADACTTFRLLFDELRKFEEDLHLHIHLENNLLFPKAIALFNNTANHLN